MQNISKMVADTRLDLMEVMQEIAYGLSIVAVRFDLQ